MTQTAPVIILAPILGAVLLALYASLGVLPAIPSVIVINIIIVYLNALVFMTYFWEFAMASWGLHRLGGSFLRLGSFLEDRMMGSKPMGNLALSLTAAYFGGLLLTYLLLSTFLPPSHLGHSDVLRFRRPQSCSLLPTTQQHTCQDAGGKTQTDGGGSGPLSTP